MLGSTSSSSSYAAVEADASSPPAPSTANPATRAVTPSPQPDTPNPDTPAPAIPVVVTPAAPASPTLVPAEVRDGLTRLLPRTPTPNPLTPPPRALTAHSSTTSLRGPPLATTPLPLPVEYPESEPPEYFDSDKVAANVYVAVRHRLRQRLVLPLAIWLPGLVVLIIIGVFRGGPTRANIAVYSLIGAIYVGYAITMYLIYRAKMRRLNHLYAAGLLADTPEDELFRLVLRNRILRPAPLYDADAMRWDEPLPFYGGVRGAASRRSAAPAAPPPVDETPPEDDGAASTASPVSTVSSEAVPAPPPPVAEPRRPRSRGASSAITSSAVTVDSAGLASRASVASLLPDDARRIYPPTSTSTPAADPPRASLSLSFGSRRRGRSSLRPSEAPDAPPGSAPATPGDAQPSRSTSGRRAPAPLQRLGVGNPTREVSPETRRRMLGEEPNLVDDTGGLGVVGVTGGDRNVAVVELPPPPRGFALGGGGVVVPPRRRRASVAGNMAPVAEASSAELAEVAARRAAERRARENRGQHPWSGAGEGPSRWAESLVDPERMSEARVRVDRTLWDGVIGWVSGPVRIGEERIDESRVEMVRREEVRAQLRQHFLLQELLEQREAARRAEAVRAAAAATGGEDVVTAASAREALNPHHNGDGAAGVGASRALAMLEKEE
ncbi:hypothetical protein HDU96_006757 [Phlyctochytrium bullatum]|nr:hypothetical protein HDU96_006757 [Phlyctochytrium bullatum]